ncbi:hypothetical protein RQP46_008452 [Phenoliferia psychrophenolica]
MAARKLATEIDKTLKKVAEGVEIFESIFDKIQVSTNQTQKEKLEADLKSQIKKLQRLRDQIKTWMQSNDIKDKQPLMDNRKLIETQMERFKACEKEMKTKAFSKEGLSAAIKLDPKEQEKADLVGWIQGQVETLEQQVEQTEAEVEQLQLHKKKKDSDKSQRLDELETLNERRSWHIARLEIILRLLENGQLGVDSVMAAKEDIAYFVESNTEEDFDEDEGIYDELNLHEEDLFGNGADDIQSSHDSQSVADDISSPASLPPMPNPPAPHPPTPKTPAKEKPAIPEAERSPTTSKPKTGPSPTARKATLESNTRPVLSTPTRSQRVPGGTTDTHIRVGASATNGTTFLSRPTRLRAPFHLRLVQLGLAAGFHRVEPRGVESDPTRTVKLGCFGGAISDDGPERGTELCPGQSGIECRLRQRSIFDRSLVLTIRRAISLVAITGLRSLSHTFLPAAPAHRRIRLLGPRFVSETFRVRHVGAVSSRAKAAE